MILALAAALLTAGAAPATSASGQRFLVETSSLKVELLDGHGGLLRTIVRHVAPYGSGPVWSPAANELAWAPQDKGLMTARLDGAPRLLIPEPPCDANGHWCATETFAWSPDGKRLLVSGLGPNRSRLEIVSVATGRRRMVARGEGLFVTGGWSPNGKWMLYSRAYDTAGARLILARGDGSDPHTLYYAPHAPDVSAASWSPDSQKIAFPVSPNRRAYQFLRVYDLQTRTSTRFPGIIPDGWPPAWSPDSMRLAVGTENAGTVTVAAAGGKPHPLGDAADTPSRPVWTATGLYVAHEQQVFRSPDGRAKLVALFPRLSETLGWFQPLR